MVINGRANNFISSYKAQDGPATFGICACEAQIGPFDKHFLVLLNISGPEWASTSMFLVLLLSFVAQFGPIWPILGQMFRRSCFELTALAQCGPTTDFK